MTLTLIRITPETATYLLRDIVKTYYLSGEPCGKARTYLLYLLFMSTAFENKWESVDGSMSIKSALVVPPDVEDREVGSRFSCRVVYHRAGVDNVSKFSFPVDMYWARMLFKTYSAIQFRTGSSPFDPLSLSVAKDTENLMNMDAILQRVKECHAINRSS